MFKKTIITAFIIFSFLLTSFLSEVRADFVESPFGFHPASVVKQGYNNNGFSDAQNIGVKWTRQGVYAFWFLVQPDLNKAAYDFSIYDRQWSAVPSGMNILANISPQGPVDEGYCLPGSYFPVDEQKYIAFVKAVVDRYNGDGINDMPGLANPIKYWQVGNEPNTIKSGFADLQRITYTAIKEVCPDCTVLIGGVPGMPPVSGYLASFDSFYRPILDALGGQYVDVMDFHWYGDAAGDYLGAKDAYDHIRAALNADGFPQIPFWIAEIGTYSGDPVPVAISNPPIDYPLQTERQQALDYFKRFIYPLSFGVKKIFPAFGLMEGFKYDGGYFDLTGLIYDGWDPAGSTPHDPGVGVKKLGYYTYKKMTEMLEGSDWGGIQTVRESDNVFIYKLTKNNRSIYVAWWDYFNDSSYINGDTKQIVLDALEGNSSIRITEVVPDFDKGKNVTDYNTAFSTTLVPVVAGQATITLGDSPVVIELSDTTPDPFSFTDQTDVDVNSVITSDPISVTGINAPTPISITACTAGACEFRVGSGSWTSAGTANNNDLVTVRQTSSPLNSVPTDLTLSIGGVSDTFRVTTAAYGKVTLLTPNGGERLAAGSTYPITWGAPATTVKFDLQYSLNGGKKWTGIASGITATNYDWNVPSQKANRPASLIKVSGYSAGGSLVGTDQSDASFTIEVIKLTSPNGGESWNSGTTQQITWNTYATTKPVAKVNLYYKTDSGGYKLITPLNTNPGTYDWPVPTVTNSKKACRVKVELRDSSGAIMGSDPSDLNFTISPAGP